jgi:hypothetical protein
MKYNSSKIALMLLVALMLIKCSDDEAITYSSSDASDRITALSSTSPGQGAALTITGSQLDKVTRIFVGNNVVPKGNFISQEATSLTFTVPPSSTLGKNALMVVWPNFARAIDTITVVQFHTISAVTPVAVASGQPVTVRGLNLNLVDEIDVNGTPVTNIISKTSGMIRFTMPAGATSGPITISSEAGSFTSASTLIACDGSPNHVACKPTINTNGSFEDGVTGIVNNAGTPGTGTAPGWNLGGSRIVAEIVEDEFFDGNKSVKITVNSVGANPWDIQPTTTMAVEQDATYRLSLWVKGSGLVSVKFALDQAGVPGYTEYGGSNTVAINSTQWQEITYDFTPAGDTDNSVRLAISMSYEGNVGGVMYMDNLRVVKLE